MTESACGICSIYEQLRTVRELERKAVCTTKLPGTKYRTNNVIGGKDHSLVDVMTVNQANINTGFRSLQYFVLSWGIEMCGALDIRWAVSPMDRLIGVRDHNFSLCNLQNAAKKKVGNYSS